MEIRISVDQRIIANLHFLVFFLYLELLGSRLVIRSVISGVVVYVCANLYG